MLFLYWPNTILPYKMAAVEQETYGNKLAPYVVYTMGRVSFRGAGRRLPPLIEVAVIKIIAFKI